MTYEFSPDLKQNQIQILYGTILGGSSIITPALGKNSYLAMRNRDKDWLEYKVEELKHYFKLDNNTIKKDKMTYRAYSIAYPIFNELRNTFYSPYEKKIVNRDTLESLNDIAWMVWYVDAGRKIKDKAYLRTQKFGEEGTKIMAEYFNSLDCFCEINSLKRTFEIVFTEKGTEEFFKVFAHRLPNFLIDRILNGHSDEIPEF